MNIYKLKIKHDLAIDNNLCSSMHIIYYIYIPGHIMVRVLFRKQPLPRFVITVKLKLVLNLHEISISKCPSSHLLHSVGDVAD